MIRKSTLSKLFLVLCISLLLSFVLGHGIVLADDYYVDAGLGTDDSLYGGSPSSEAWKTITYALSQVSGSEGNPHIIHVAPGIYYENIVMKDYVDLLGSGYQNTIIDGEDTVAWIKEDTMPPAGNNCGRCL